MYIHDGSPVEFIFNDNNWTATINGLRFCSSTESGLLQAIRQLYQVSVVEEHYAEPVVPAAVHYNRILSGKYSLEDRQDAFKRLAGNSDPLAVSAVLSVTNKPTSINAHYLTKALNKKDFAEVTRIEISENINNLIHRASLLHELSERLTLC